MKEKIAVWWIRQDLRCNDNPALQRAQEHERVLPIYILDHSSAGKWKMGAASKWWLHHSIEALEKTLATQVSLYTGNPADVFKTLQKRYDVTGVYWNRCYEPWRMKRDEDIKAQICADGIDVQSFNGSLLWEPWEVYKDDKTPYKVFTAFFTNGCAKAKKPRKPLGTNISKTTFLHDHQSQSLAEFSLISKVTWYTQIAKQWTPGEDGAQKKLQFFLQNNLKKYKEARDIPSEKATSYLSPHLHFGEISPQTVWYETEKLQEDKQVNHFKSELAWREFSYAQLYYNPTLPEKNLQKKFDGFPWQNKKTLLKKWQKGMTGYPIVDAGMRELWETGYMHNRVRMIVASFLIKNLLIHWKYGEEWFWDTLVDADLANNAASWQWVAGSGRDAAPYFRIFNPITQGEKFDPDGIYTLQYVPELKDLPKKYLFKPWEAPSNVLKKANNIELGRTYPKPIISIPESRAKALKAFKEI